MTAFAHWALAHPLVFVPCLWLLLAPLADMLPENRRHD